MNTENASTRNDTAHIVPDELLGSFTASRLGRWFLVATVLHLLVVGLFSVGTIRDLVDPEGAASREAARATSPEPPTPEPVTVASPTTPAAKAAAEAPGDERELTPIEKASAEAAAPGEIPESPDDLGLTLEDTKID